MTKLAKGILSESQKIHVKFFGTHRSCQFKSGDLRKDKSDPVAGLSTGPQLIKHCVIDVLLGVEKAMKIVGIGYERSSRRAPEFRAYSILSRFWRLCRAHRSWTFSAVSEVPPFENGRM